MKIEIKDLSFSYGKDTVFKNINISINSGDFFVLRGQNGTGKTTLIKHLTKDIKSQSNKIFINDKDITTIKNNIVSYLPQKSPSLNYNFPISCYEVLRAANNKKNTNNIDNVLKKVQLFKYKNSNFNSLSGGQLQRLLLARLLIDNKDCIILDEPFVGIDVENVSKISNILVELNKDGKTIIIITHNSLDIKTETKIFDLGSNLATGSDKS